MKAPSDNRLGNLAHRGWYGCNFVTPTLAQIHRLLADIFQPVRAHLNAETLPSLEKQQISNIRLENGSKVR